MDNKELKKIIKKMVRESLAELFLEMNLETIVEGVVRRKMPQVKAVSRPVVQQVAEHKPIVESAQVDNKQQLRSKIKSLVGADDSEWASIYKDTIEHDNPILTGDDSGGPELVSESTLRNSGLLRDYSRFVK